MPTPKTIRERSSKRAGLTPKERRFVVEYLVDQSQAGAAARAGYSEHTAKEIGYELMHRPRVKAAIARALEEQQQRVLITADKVLLDIQNGGNAALKAQEFHAFLRSRHLLGLHFKLFTEKHEHGGIGGGPIQMTVSSVDEKL